MINFLLSVHYFIWLNIYIIYKGRGEGNLKGKEGVSIILKKFNCQFYFYNVNIVTHTHIYIYISFFPLLPILTSKTSVSPKKQKKLLKHLSKRIHPSLRYFSLISFTIISLQTFNYKIKYKLDKNKLKL